LSAAPGTVATLPKALAPMQATRRWLVWRWETNDRGKRTKVPYRATDTSTKASSTDPATWGDYETARDVVLAGRADGIGYSVHNDDIAAFDLDDCIDENGTIATWAWDLIDEADSYVERTVSGTGLRILGFAIGNKIHRKQKVPGTPSSLETYRRAERYIVVTGAALDGFGGELRNVDAPMDEWVAKLDAEAKAEKDRERAAKAEANGAKAFEDHARTSAGGSTDLPPELDYMIRYGVKEGHRSEKFFHVVGWLKDRGMSPGEVEALLSAYPNGIAEKYVGRLRAEIDRAFDKAETKHRASNGTGSTSEDTFAKSPGAQEGGKDKREPGVLFYGDRTPEPPPWLIREILPQTQVGILAGQHSAGKTFIGIDISLSTMTALPFIGHEVERQGAVLWLAAEGASEVTIRLKAAAVHRLGKEAVGELPFAYQVADVPTLSDADALPKLMRLVEDTKAGLAERFPGVDLVMIVVDTLNSAAGFADENSASEAQKVFNVLRRLSGAAGALVLVVDHYGKMTETGVRGSSAKSGAADAILAVMADKDEVTGKITNRRLAVTKLRGAATGMVVPFTLKPVPIDPWGNTHCGVEWDAVIDPNTSGSQKPQRPAWSGNARVLKDAIERAMIDFGKTVRPFTDGSEVKAVAAEKVRAEFYASYPAENAEAKKKAFKRLLDGAIAKHLVASREVVGTDFLWFVQDNQ